jgi:hypothetical protein
LGQRDVDFKRGRDRAAHARQRIDLSRFDVGDRAARYVGAASQISLRQAGGKTRPPYPLTCHDQTVAFRRHATKV